MLTEMELQLVTRRSREWQGPNAWAWIDGYRLDLAAALTVPGFG